MRIFLAGATGALGRPLLSRLLVAGHDVVATSRDQAKAAALTAAGATGIALDAFDSDAVRQAIADVRPEVVIHELTALPQTLSPAELKQAVVTTTRLRTETVPVFAAAARDAGARRIIVQSIAFATAPTGPRVVDENHPLYTDAPKAIRTVVQGVATMETAAGAVDGIEAVVLRYGFLYGPGTWYERTGAVGHLLAKRRLPRIGSGEGHYSWIHVDDAAAVTAAALDSGAAGIYNVCDSEPAMAKDWLPVAVAALGAKKPFHVPARLVAMFGGAPVVYYDTQLRGASNAKMLDAFGVTPRPWREGLPAAFA
jgi:nucleoside-diphosphate-sugar epimerase